ncbi:hypothetical protein CGRA01v4_05804 [Colletotrichum graminicola]|nr:hypothetical protein CGRA01v4_05804 [Colletotrichum graminicola]
MSQLALQTRSAQGSTSDSDASGSTASTSRLAAVTESIDAPVFAGAPGTHHPRLPRQKHPLHRLQVADISSHSFPSSKDGPATGLLIPVSDPASITISTANISTTAAASHSPTSPLLTPSPRYVPRVSLTKEETAHSLLCSASLPLLPSQFACLASLWCRCASLLFLAATAAVAFFYSSLPSLILPP